MSALVCLGRRTITGLLTASGRQFVDWSAAYRLFEHERFATDPLFAPARRGVGEALGLGEPLGAMLDDTLLRKTGRTVHGAAWRRDALGPPFQTNLVWGQRFMQISAALPEQSSGPSRARAIPIDLLHCPTPKKPGKRASEKQWSDYRQAQNQTKLTQQAAERLCALRHNMNGEKQNKNRQLIVAVDGAYTNRTVFKQLPEKTTLIGRLRKDAKLYDLPEQTPRGQRGRKRRYGNQLPTPEKIRQDKSIPWQTVEAFAAGKIRSFDVKTIGPLRWAAAGGQANLRLVVVRPLAYRLTKGSRTLYRNPAYLICTDPDLPLEKLLQYYLWRWEIELNFRDEKTLLGLGEAQVRTPSAVQKAPELIVAAYACLMLAVDQNRDQNKAAMPPTPKWQKPKPNGRTTTTQAIALLRAQFWGQAIGIGNLKRFDKPKPKNTKPKKIQNQLAAAIIYAAR